MYARFASENLGANDVMRLRTRVSEIECSRGSWRGALGVWLIGWAAGCGDFAVQLAPEAVDSERSAIVSGKIDKGHPAVGILHSGTGSACTATLIGPKTLLTAAHCVTTQKKPHKVLSPIRFIVGSLSGKMYPGVSAAVHPNYSGGNKSDIAVVRLYKPVTGVAPMPWSVTKPTKGEPITLVGYGRTSTTSNEFGTKRKTSNKVGQVSSTVFSFFGSNGGSVCQGDSGGPTLGIRDGKETVIGVHSTATFDCKSGGTDIRVDAYQQWIKQQLSTSVYGSQCQKQSDCLSSLCLQAGSTKYCTQECDTKPCPFGDKCVPVSGVVATKKACVPNSGVGPKELGEPCDNGLDCASQICVPIPQQGLFLFGAV